jgi:hypothetical protein
MEVHHHPGPHHKTKKFKGYFLEPLMIFLAVALGFFAEIFREHISEKGKAVVFARSLYADFKSDPTLLHQLVSFTDSRIRTLDSLDHFIQVKSHGGEIKVETAEDEGTRLPFGYL